MKKSNIAMCNNVDNETGVLYLSNGDGLTPMYNADGTLKTAKQEE